MKLLCFLIIISVSSAAVAVERVEFATHYDHPPFILDIKDQTGLVFDLANYLSKQSKGRYEFQVTFVPRERLQNYLVKKQKVVIPFVSPKWFDDVDQSRYLWTGILLMDQNVVVTLAKKKFEYKGPDSLTGKTMGYVLGHKMPAIEPLVNQGKIKREESPSMIGNFKKLVEGRVDFVVTGEMIAKDLIARENWQIRLSISKEPIDVFERRVLISPHSEVGLQKWLNIELKTLMRSPRWRTFLERYNAQNLSIAVPEESDRKPAKVD
ncbi:substrate-binding periplasmic protein [Bdellovibrio sp. HCB337]|uniref:substrate-binding periplasmic protein n=1 Tax=Bdellovibrio sp. HCB337 TaxID=3394358 RepID=UPI0039A50DBF